MTPQREMTAMTPTHTENLKTNLSTAGGHVKQAAVDSADALRGAAAAAGENALGKATKSDLADGATGRPTA